jgi:hypothetical protein
VANSEIDPELVKFRRRTAWVLVVIVGFGSFATILWRSLGGPGARQATHDTIFEDLLIKRLFAKAGRKIPPVANSDVFGYRLSFPEVSSTDVQRWAKGRLKGDWEVKLAGELTTEFYVSYGGGRVNSPVHCSVFATIRLTPNSAPYRHAEMIFNGPSPSPVDTCF